MSNSKHTPGPWSEAYVYGALRYIGRNVDLDCFLSPEDQFDVIERWDDSANCEVQAKFNIPTHFNRADVALIAAAPDLLAALERIAAIHNRPVGPDWEEIEEARSIANAALALIVPRE